MSWYYAENNERRGPFEEADFQSLVNAGTIKPETLVWREGFAAWVPYSSAASAVSPASTNPGGVAGAPGSSAVACGQCGRLFPADETVMYEGRHVCAECKPLFFQKIKEGALVVSGPREYAGFWIRVGAKVIDGIILQAGGFVVGLIIGFLFRGNDAVAIMGFIAGLLLNAAYVIYFTGNFGATPGKMACKLQIIRADGSPLTFGTATGRYFGEMLSGLTLGIGYIMVAFDEEKRALHDRVCDTRVVRKPNR